MTAAEQSFADRVAGALLPFKGHPVGKPTVRAAIARTLDEQFPEVPGAGLHFEVSRIDDTPPRARIDVCDGSGAPLGVDEILRRIGG